MEDKQLLDKLEQDKNSSGKFPKRWKPTFGDQVVGSLVRVEEFEGQHGLVRTAVLRTEAGADFSVFLTPSVLARKWNECAPQPGDRVAIEFVGEARSEKTGRTYKNFALATEPATMASGQPSNAVAPRQEIPDFLPTTPPVSPPSFPIRPTEPVAPLPYIIPPPSIRSREDRGQDLASYGADPA